MFLIALSVFSSAFNKMLCLSKHFIFCLYVLYVLSLLEKAW